MIDTVEDGGWGMGDAILLKEADVVYGDDFSRARETDIQNLIYRSGRQVNH